MVKLYARVYILICGELLYSTYDSPAFLDQEEGMDDRSIKHAL